MHSTHLRGDRGVTNVLGIVLLVSIVVILAATVGVSVLGSGISIPAATPLASISVSDAPGEQVNQHQSDEFIDINHDSGESLQGD